MRVLAEVYPEELCGLAAICQLDGDSGHLDLAAEASMPLGTRGVEGPQLRECFIRCSLPKPGLTLSFVHLRCEPACGRCRMHAGRGPCPCAWLSMRPVDEAK